MLYTPFAQLTLIDLMTKTSAIHTRKDAKENFPLVDEKRNVCVKI